MQSQAATQLFSFDRKKIHRKDHLLELACAAATFISSLAFNTVGSLVHTIGLSLHVADAKIAAVTTTMLVTAVFVGLVTPMIAKHISIRMMILAALAIVALSSGTSALATSYPVLLVAQALGSTGIAILGAAPLVVVSARLRGREQRRAVGICVGAGGIATLLGIPVEGLLAAHYGWHLAFVFLGVAAIAAALLVAKYVKSGQETRSSAPTRLPLWQIYADSFALPSVAKGACLLLFFAMAWVGTWVYVGTLLAMRYHLSSGAASWIFCATGGSFLGAILILNTWGLHVSQRRHVVSMCLVLVAVIGVTFLLNAPLPLVLVALTIGSGTFAVARTSVSSLAVALNPGCESTLLSLFNMMSNVGAAFGGIVGGTLLMYGWNTVGLAFGACALIALVLAWRLPVQVLTTVRLELHAGPEPVRSESAA